MARKPTKRNPQRSPGGTAAKAPTGPAGSNRENIIAAFMALLAEQRIEQIGFADIAARAGVPVPTV